MKGDWAKALECHTEALRIRRKALGDGHSDVATSLNNIGLIYNAKGEHAQALASFEESLRIKRIALGPDHHAVATTLCNIGSVYQVRRRQLAAEQADKIAAGHGRPAEGPGVL